MAMLNNQRVTRVKSGWKGYWTADNTPWNVQPLEYPQFHPTHTKYIAHQISEKEYMHKNTMKSCPTFSPIQSRMSGFTSHFNNPQRLSACAQQNDALQRAEQTLSHQPNGNTWDNDGRWRSVTWVMTPSLPNDDGNTFPATHF